MDNSKTINDVRGKIERERRIMNGASAMRQSSPNPALQAQADVQIRESRRNIDYLDGILRDLQMRSGMSNMSLGDGGRGNSQGGYTGQQQSYRGGNPYGPEHVRAGSVDAPDGSGYGDRHPSNAPFGPSGPAGTPKAKPNYSKLGTPPSG